MITSFFCLECEKISLQVQGNERSHSYPRHALPACDLVSVQGTRVGYTVVAVASCGDGSVYRTRIRQS